VRGEDDVRKGSQRLGDLRLVFVDVKSGAGDLACCERLGEGLFVDDRPARRIHQNRVRLHRGKLGRPKEVMGLGSQRTVEADDVRAGEKIPKLDAFERSLPSGKYDLHPEGRREPGDLPSNPPEADDPERPSAERPAEHERRRPLPPRAGADNAVPLRNPPRNVEEKRNRELGRRLREDVRCVRNQNASSCRRLEVDVVEPDRVVRDDPEIRAGRVEELLVDLIGEHRHDSRAPAHPSQELGAGRRAISVVDAHIEAGLELAVNGLGNAPREEDGGLQGILLAVGIAASHHADVRELTPELRALYELSRAAAQGAAGVETLLDRICVTVTETFGFTRAMIFRLHEESGLLTPLAAHGIPLEEIPRGLRIDDQPLFANAAESGEAVFVEDVSQSEAITSEVVDEFDLRSVLAMPLMSTGRCLGVLGADRTGEQFELEPGTLDILTTIGAVAGVYLERALETSELRQLNEMARSFVALASHELRTPAAVVHGIAATLNLRGDQLTDEQRTELRRTLHEQTDRLRRLVDQLLDLSRLEAHAIEIRPQTFRVRRRVEELLLMVAAERVGEVDLDIDPTLEADADPDAFDRVVSNLLTNAFRYGEAPIRVRAREEPDGGTLVLTVEDNGRGVAPEFVPRLFERFARADISSASVAGSGLGLAIAQSYARAHGGEILYSAAEPSGACFELVLPSTSF
jgi:signal transduction histidine kinase